MVRRKRRSDRAEFWGCPRFPDCRGTRDLAAIRATRPRTEPETVVADGSGTALTRREAGTSARATYEHRRARHEERVRRARPRILVAGLAVAIAGVVLLGQSGTWPFVGMALLFMSAMTTLGALFGTPAHVRAWKTGAIAEEHVGRVLDQLEQDGFRVLHDRRRPGGRDNIDHIVIGPTGVFVVETKHYAATVRVRGGELFIAGRRKPGFVDQVLRQIESVSGVLGVPVTGLICVVDGEFPLFGSTRVGGIDVVPPTRLARLIHRAPLVWDPFEVERVSALAAAALPPQ